MHHQVLADGALGAPLRLGRRLPNLLSGLARSPRAEPLSFCGSAGPGVTSLLALATRLLFAHGAGAPASSPWMRRFRTLLSSVGEVSCFDYPYFRDGAARRAPDKLQTLVLAHSHALEALRSECAPADRLILAGKSMGGRVGCHLALNTPVSGLVCFGYPLRGQNGKLRDEVLLQLRTPVMFVQGTRDPLCTLSDLERVREHMAARSQLFIVDGGNHSLEVTKTALKAQGTTQTDVELAIVAAVREFCEGL